MKVSGGNGEAMRSDRVGSGVGNSRGGSRGEDGDERREQLGKKGTLDWGHFHLAGQGRFMGLSCSVQMMEDVASVTHSDNASVRGALATLLFKSVSPSLPLPLPPSPIQIFPASYSSSSAFTCLLSQRFGFSLLPSLYGSVWVGPCRVGRSMHFSHSRLSSLAFLPPPCPLARSLGPRPSSAHFVHVPPSYAAVLPAGPTTDADRKLAMFGVLKEVSCSPGGGQPAIQQSGSHLRDNLPWCSMSQR